MAKDFEELVHSYEKYEAIHDCENVIGRLFYYSSSCNGEEIASLWADRDDCSLEFPFGGYAGIEGVRRFYLQVMGDRSDPAVYERIRGVMNVSLLENEIVEVAEDRQTARGVWLSPGMETYGESARFADCRGNGYWVYAKIAADFLREDGVWKLWHLRWYLVFHTEYHTDWVVPQEYRGYVLADPQCDFPPRTPVTAYDINAIADDGFILPAAYRTFADVAPGYGYDRRA